MIKILLSAVQSLVHSLSHTFPAIEAQRVDNDVVVSPVGPIYAIRDTRQGKLKGLLTLLGPMRTRSEDKIWELLRFTKVSAPSLIFTYFGSNAEHISTTQGLSPHGSDGAGDYTDKLSLVVGEEHSWHVFLMCEKLRVFRYNHTLQASICQSDDVAAGLDLKNVMTLVFDVFGEEKRGEEALWRKLEAQKEAKASGPKRLKSLESLHLQS